MIHGGPVLMMVLGGLAAGQPAAALDTCEVRGIPLFGKVGFVESFPDVTIEVVDSFPDLRVQRMVAFADDCGEWQITENFPDFTIQIVEHFGDIRIQWVDSFPGID